MPKPIGDFPFAVRASQPSPASYRRLVVRMTRMRGWRSASLGTYIWVRGIDDADATVTVATIKAEPCHLLCAEVCRMNIWIWRAMNFSLLCHRDTASSLHLLIVLTVFHPSELLSCTPETRPGSARPR